MQRILLLDDQPDRYALIQGSLEADGFCVVPVGPESLMRHLIEDNKAALLIVGLPQPQYDSVLLCRDVRAHSQIPMLIVTDSLPTAAIVALLEGGADDYLLTPCAEADLLIRVRAVLRRVHNAAELLQAGAGTITLDRQTRNVRIRGMLIAMTPIEYALLLRLMQQAGTTLPYTYLLQELTDALEGADMTHLTVYIWHLRKKIELDPRHPTLLQELVETGYQLLR